MNTYKMVNVTIQINEALYQELLEAAKDCGMGEGFNEATGQITRSTMSDERKVEDFVGECVESVLASRRLKRRTAAA